MMNDKAEHIAQVIAAWNMRQDREMLCRKGADDSHWPLKHTLGRLCIHQRLCLKSGICPESSRLASKGVRLE